MKKISLLVAILGLAACQHDNVEYRDGIYDDGPEYYTDSDAAQYREEYCGGEKCSVVHYSMPNGNDLQLETERHIIKINAEPNAKYRYNIWTGRDTERKPDLIIENGVIIEP